MSVQPWGSAHGKTREHRFGEKLWYDPATGCIEWMGRLSTKGYGGFNFRVGSKRRAHRVAYEWMVGPIPDGLTIDHLCRNRRCVNPEHLEPVTNRENLMRGDGVAARNARKAECSRGHPFDDANTYHIPGKPWRKCRRCRADWEIKRRPRGDQD